MLLPILLTAALHMAAGKQTPGWILLQALLATILTLLERHVQTLQTQGFQPIQAAYTDNWLHTGQQVNTAVHHHTHRPCMSQSQAPLHNQRASRGVDCCQVTWKGEDGERDVSMEIKGLTPDGYLLAADDSGERYSLSPDGNSLDFFKGLIRSKLPR
jgi:biotin---protein ligase